MDYTLINLFKKHFQAQYTAIIKNSNKLIPSIIDRIFTEKRQGFVPTVAPKAIKVLKTIPSTEMCEYFIEALLLTSNHNQPCTPYGTVAMMLQKALKQLTFLLDIYQLEIFFSESDNAQVFGAAYDHFVELFVSKPSGKTMPNV